ncbi:MAG: cell wall hydrolase [Sphingomonadaceae bacterium]|nr:cell wall hydrolase [Sphingomonadaceae bacterium]
MAFGRKTIAVALTAAALSGAAFAPYAPGFAYESEAETSDADGALLAEAGLTASDIANDRIIEPVIALDEVAEPAPAPETVIPEPVPAQYGMDDETECLAKIVLHEAGNQSRDGQLAVAQVVMNRVNSGRFADTICGVALQRGQFFNVHAYNPPRDARWDRAVEIALDARHATSAPVVADALFFHAAYAQPSFFRSRQRVARLGDHVFYR